MSTIKVVAAVLDRQELELIKPDGSVVRLKQGDIRIRPILAQVKAAVESGNIPVEIELKAVDTTFTDFEEKTGGVVKLFRVAASKLKKFFGFGKSGEEVEAELKDQTIGNLPVQDEAPPAPTAAEGQTAAAPDKLDAAIDSIMEQAIPASDAAFEADDREAGRQEETVVVAVVDGKHVVPHADKLASQMRHSIKGSTEGIENFMRRCAAVATKRSHSMEDLMKFMHRGDLPVTVNGDIVAYKVLRRAKSYMNDAGQMEYVDCHSRKVRQKVGSHVFMAEKLVDHNRNRECSNGLHVARRQYVRGFSGDVLTLIIVRPEDVIAVPEYDANKMRVCGYHIVHELPDADYRAICADKPLVTEVGKAALAKALAGDTIGITQTVEITEGYGGGLKITDLVDSEVADEQAEEAIKLTDTSVQAESVDISEPHEVQDAPVDVKEVAAEAVVVKATGTRAEQAKALHQAWVKAGAKQEGTEYTELLAFKKSAKISWEKLGLPSSPSGNVLAEPYADQVAAANADWVAPVNTQPLVDPTPRERVKGPAKPKQKLTKKQKKQAAAKAAYLKRSKPAEAAPVAAPIVEAPTPKVEAPKASKGGPSAQIAAIMERDGKITASNAGELLAIKKAAKKSWDKLGVPESDAKLILDLAK